MSSERLGWRAMVESDFAADGIRIHVGQRVPQGMLVFNFDVELSPVEEHVNTASMASPLRLTDDAGRALLDALAEHYGGVSSVRALRALRADYDAERKRVDMLTSALVKALTFVNSGRSDDGMGR